MRSKAILLVVGVLLSVANVASATIVRGIDMDFVTIGNAGNAADTGKLPDALPAGLPIDMFSGKPFEYSKTEDSFVLKCPGKDLSKDEAYEYKFKVQ